jgi:lycopene cyclase domain-containing protein
MTYFGVLLGYILPPLLLLMIGWAVVPFRRQQRTGHLHRTILLALSAHVGLALLYTTPWDNYLVATQVWWYEPTLVSGIRLGWVPLEEYIFFAMQTLLTGSWVAFLFQWVWRSRLKIAERVNMRQRAALIILLLWLFAAGTLWVGWKPLTYLMLILVWALFPLGLQLAFAADLLWANWRFLLAAILPPTFYLWWVDALAIRKGTWTIDPQQTTGILLGTLPIEEMLFFLATNVMIVFGMTLVLSPAARQRLSIWWRVIHRALSQT